jgi:hypothetical protein
MSDLLADGGPEALVGVLESARPMQQSGVGSNADARGDRAAAELKRDAPSFAEAYGPEELRRDRDRKLVSMAALPGPPSAGQVGYGMGPDLNRIIGGGVCRGQLIAVGASRAGAGKTSLVMQWMDGLALATAAAVASDDQHTLCPQLIVSEMGVPELTWRSLGNYTGYGSRVFRAGASQSVGREDAKGTRNAAFAAGAEALTADLGLSRSFQHAIRVGGKRGEGLLTFMAIVARGVRNRLQEQYQREVQLFVLIDPVQRWLGAGRAVEAQDGFIERLAELTQEEGWVTFVTSDTNKAGATNSEQPGRSRQQATAAFRGSYKLLHLPDTVMIIDSDTPPQEGQSSVEVTVGVVKNRWGPAMPEKSAEARFAWTPATGRFRPLEHSISPAPRPAASEGPAYSGPRL